MRNALPRLTLIAAIVLGSCSYTAGQLLDVEVREGAGVATEVETIYQRGVEFLRQTQKENGTWEGSDPPAVCGLAVMAFLSTGEDPNFGKYAGNIRRALRFMIGQQQNSGFIPGTMYVHGFSMLALAEAYGAVDDEMLWAGKKRGRSLGEALELAVRFAVKSQSKNQFNAWRYSPGATDADTSVAGAVIMGLLAARNAGIEVPDKSIDNAMKYLRQMTRNNGEVAYSGFGGLGASDARSAIACLVFSIGKHKDWKQFDATKEYLLKTVDINSSSSWPFYQRYYKAQALFQADYDAWKRWNSETIRILKSKQDASGKIGGRSSHGAAYQTSMSLLALALNYRFLPIYER